MIKIDEVCKQFNYELRLMDDDGTIKMYNEMKGSNIGDYEFYGLKHLIDYNKSFKDKTSSKKIYFTTIQTCIKTHFVSKFSIYQFKETPHSCLALFGSSFATWSILELSITIILGQNDHVE